MKIKIFLYIAAAMLSLYCQFASACVARLLSISQYDSDYSTAVKVQYYCAPGSGGYCLITVVKDGVTKVSEQIASGYQIPYEFDYGVGDYTVTLGATYLSAIGSHATYTYTTYDTASITITVDEPPYAKSVKNYTYDALGRLKSVEEEGKDTTTYGYDDADNRTSKTIVEK